MPDGFDPHVELARIWSLRDLMVACREDMPKVIEMYRKKLDQLSRDPDASVQDMVLLGETINNRAVGKPRQHVMVSDGNDTGKRITILPDNGRDRNRQLRVTPVIESAVE